MGINRWMARVLLFALLLWSVAGRGETVEIRLHGSNTLGSKLAPALLQSYARDQGFAEITQQETAPAEYTISGQHPDGRDFIGVVRAHGTNTGFADLLSGTADLWMASRAASAEEAQAALAVGNLHTAEQEHIVALDGLAIAVHADNPIKALSLTQVRAAFAGEVRNWREFGGADSPITLYARDEKSGTFDSFKSMVMIDGATLAEGARRYESSTDLEKAITEDPSALGFVGFSYVASARALAVFEGPTVALRPNALSIATEDYLLARRLYFYSAKDCSPAVRDFIEFALGTGGQQSVTASGFVSQNIFSAPEAPLAGNPDAYYDVVTRAERLSLNFRFRPHSSLLDSRALRDIDRLSAYMKNPANRRKQIRLAAFSTESTEGSPFRVLLNVNDRIDYLAQMLGIHGVATSMSRGFVGGTPVAPPGKHPDQSARNERVEVWIIDPKA